MLTILYLFHFMIVIEKPKEAGKHCKEGFVFLNNIRKLNHVVA